MDKSVYQLVKGVAILIMLVHHFVDIPFSTLPHLVNLIGHAGKICVAMYAVMSGYGYYFAKEKTLKYGIKKIFELLKVYWFSLFLLFIPMAMLNGWELTLSSLIVQLFGLTPNLNWFAWYVFFYMFCMLVMPIIYKFKMLQFKSNINLILLLTVPYLIKVIFRFMPGYESNIIVTDLYICFSYLPCFLIGHWFAENKIYEKLNSNNILKKPMVCIMGILLIYTARIFISSILGFYLDVFYAPLMIGLINNLFKNNNYKPVRILLAVFGRYSTSIWFFHAVFFATYVCDLFKPILMIVSWPPLMFVWLVILSLLGAIIYQELLEKLESIIKNMRFKSVNNV